MKLGSSYLKKVFPNLINYEIYKNSEDPLYNCISYSISKYDVWSLSKSVDKDYYWPIENKSETTESFDEFYKYHGFYIVNNIDIRYVKGSVKVALYGSGDITKHASIQLDEFYWESKIGSGEIIKHDIFELEGGLYGDVIRIYIKML